VPVGPRTCVAYAAAVLLTAGCAGVTPAPETTVSQASPAVTPAPSVPIVTPPVAPRAAGRGAPAVLKAPGPVAPAPRPAAPPAAAPRAVAASPASAAPLTLDLPALKERLRATNAIGIFTKISLKNKVDDLLGHFRDHYRGKPTPPPTMTELRTSYDLLMMKVLTLLQDSDQTLAASIVSSREAIWGLLSDPDTFAALQS